VGQVPILGVVWYRRIAYPELKTLFDDGDLLPILFEDWQSLAEGGRASLIRRGYDTIRVYIELDTFPKWCRVNHCRPNGLARSAFADLVAIQAQKDRFKV
jgi:hypothetical protein